MIFNSKELNYLKNLMNKLKKNYLKRKIKKILTKKTVLIRKKYQLRKKIRQPKKMWETNQLVRLSKKTILNKKHKQIWKKGKVLKLKAVKKKLRKIKEIVLKLIIKVKNNQIKMWLTHRQKGVKKHIIGIKVVSQKQVLLKTKNREAKKLLIPKKQRIVRWKQEKNPQ